MNTPSCDRLEKNQIIAMLLEKSNTIVQLVDSMRSEIVQALCDIALTREQIVDRCFPLQIRNTYGMSCCQRALTQIAKEESLDLANRKKAYHGTKGRITWDRQVSLLGEEEAKRLARERGKEYARQGGVVPYSDEEKLYIMKRKQESGPLVGVNDAIAQECNHLFHDDKPIRNGTTLAKKYAKWKK